MKISKILVLAGASAMTLGVMFTSVEAKRSQPEVKAKHHSHSVSQRSRLATKAKKATKTTRSEPKNRQTKVRRESPVQAKEAMRPVRGEDKARLGTLFASAAESDVPAGTLTGNAPAKKAVKSVTFDVEAGIKTTIMTDGSIEEEPFDSGMLSKLIPEHGGTNSLAAFVDKLRKIPLPETTGSTAPIR